MNLATIRKAQNGDRKSINEIIRIYSPAIKYVGRKFYVNFYDMDDLEQIARIGIWKGILKFQEDRLKDDQTDSQVKRLFSVCVKHHIRSEVHNVIKKQNRIKRQGTEVEFREACGMDYKTVFENAPEIYNHINNEKNLNMTLDLEKNIPIGLKKALSCVMKTKNISEAARLYKQRDNKFRTTMKHIGNSILKSDLVNC